MFSKWDAFKEDRNGNVAIATALLLPALLGGTGLGFEVSYWYYTERALQNAADSAAVAAATNAGANYDLEAKLVAARYGFRDGENNVTVNVSKTTACPSGGNCYSVSISGQVPLFLSRMVGFEGDSSTLKMIGGKQVVSRTKTISARAVAERIASPRKYCVLALGTAGAKFEDVLVNGGSKSNLTNCGIMSNTDMQCNGQGQIADYADYTQGTPSGCGREPERGPVSRLPDPYASLATNIPPNTCTAYLGRSWSGIKGLPEVETICGDLTLTGNVEITSQTALVIYNGRLNTNGYTLTGKALTIIFAGDNGSYGHYPTGGGTLTITAPTTGIWKGVAIYQAPGLTSGVDITAAGNKPTWNITGLVYLPKANITISGAVNKAGNGSECFGLVAGSIRVNGTGQILTNGDSCDAAGLDLPAVRRGKLVG